MNFSDVLKQILYFIQNNIKILDLLILINFLVFVFEETGFGIYSSFTFLFSVACSFFASLIFYSGLARILKSTFDVSSSLAESLSFLVIGVLVFSFNFFLLRPLRKRLDKSFSLRKIDSDLRAVNFVGSFFFASLSFFFLLLFLTMVLLSFPSSKLIKDQIIGSITGRFLSLRAQAIELNLNKLFSVQSLETLNFVTLEPSVEEAIKLDFVVNDYGIDNRSEEEMLIKINEERKKYTLPLLQRSSLLTDLAREKAEDMIKRRYFGHNSPEGYTPFDRMTSVNVIYSIAAENLAISPDVEIAMNGLMDSSGHRQNILSKKFYKIGIGVIDVGEYGKVFVQEFTD